jgi:DNA-binding MarR family transcriptional regulator
VRKGLLERHEDPADRRQVLVAATATAVEQIEQMSEFGRTRMRELLGRVRSDADAKTIERAIRIMSDAMADLYEEAR